MDRNNIDNRSKKRGHIMNEKPVKVYTYRRVSTELQIDGYSLSAQDEMLKAYADMHGYQIVGEYSDEGKSGKNMAGRPEFRKMLDDIRSKKDGVRYVMVFKLSRFGRNSADIMNSLQFIQDYGVDLICVKDGVCSEEGSGKLIINVLAAVAEIERENIHEQTMAGRMQKAKEGRWNGGFAPYGYELVDGSLVIKEDEAEAVRIIFDKFVHTDLGYTGVAKYLENNGISKVARQNGKLTMFSAVMVKKILDNPVYMGKIAYGRTKNAKVEGERNVYHRVVSKDYEIHEGLHEGIVTEELFLQAQLKRKETVRKLEKKHDLEHEHILSGIIKCPVCGAGMYGNISRTRKKDGTFYPTSYQYGCKHRLKIYGHKCDYRKTYGETKIDNAVAEIVKGLVTKPQFTEILKKKIDESVDVKELQLQVDNIEKQIRNQENTQKRLMEQQDNLDVSIPDYDKRYDDLSERIDRAYAKIYELNVEMDELDTRITNAQKDKLSASNIYYYLQAFGQLYDVMTDAEKKQMYSHLLKEVQIFEAPKENGQIIKSLKFTFPIDDTGRTEFCVDENLTVETVVLLSKGAKGPVDLCSTRTEVERS